MTKIFGQDGEIIDDIADVQTEVDNLDGGAMRGTDSALLAANYATERGTDNALLAVNYTAERGTDNALLAANYTAERGTDNAALASVWTAVLATALAYYTATRAGYIDNINNVNLATIANISSLTATNIAYLNNINNANLATIADISSLTATNIAYLDELAAANIPTDIGENDDEHDGDTLFGRLRQLIEHVHSVQSVYPTLADGVSLTASANDWALGTIVEIVPTNTITNEFDIHEVLVEDVNTQDKTYELVLYYGGSDTECGRTRFAASSTKGGVPAVAMQTILIPANSRIRGQLAIQDGGSKTAKVSLRYHTY